MLPENQTHYAVMKLNESARSIALNITDMPALRRRLEKYKDNKVKARELYNDLTNHRNRVCDAINTATLSLFEMELMDLADYSAKLNQSVKSFNLMTPDYQKLCVALSGYLTKLPVAETTNASIVGRLMNNIKLGYYPTDLENIGHMARGIEFPENVTVNLFDPCCGCGLALRTLAQEKNCSTYGIELDRGRAEEALTRLNRVGFGSYFHSRVSHEAFHAMLLNPPYLSVMTEGGNKTRSEKRFLTDTIWHLMYGGLLIYIIPYYRLTADVCRVLCDNFANLTVWKFTGSEFNKFNQIAVMGIRCKRRDGSEMVQQLASIALTPNDIPELTELPDNRYALPAVAKKIETFKGAEFNVAELTEQLKNSNSFTRLFEKSKLDSDIKRPLLPLNIGQIGLVGGSGLINGLVECDTPHIIKGRIIKENNIASEENFNIEGDLMSTTLYETRVNKMVFNILTPDGFKSLS